MNPFKIILCLFAFSFSQGRAAEKNAPTVSGISLKKVNLEQAVKELNRVIWKEHGQKKQLLVAYVELAPPPKPAKSDTNQSSKLLNLLPFNGRSLSFDLQLEKNPPIITVVQYLCDKSRCHYRVIDGQIIVYGWHKPQLIEDEEPK